jgi:hypothetical protein
MHIFDRKVLSHFHPWRCSSPHRATSSCSKEQKSFPLNEHPGQFLEHLAKTYRVPVQALPFELAIDRFLSYLEEAKTRRIGLPGRFFLVATILLQKYSEVVLGFSLLRVQALSDHLQLIHRDRPQAAKWKYTDWIHLARLVLRNHKPKVALYFNPFHPDINDITKEVDLPYAARRVSATPPSRGRRRLVPTPLTALLDEAATVIEAASNDFKAAEYAINAMKASPPNPPQNTSRTA